MSYAFTVSVVEAGLRQIPLSGLVRLRDHLLAKKPILLDGDILSVYGPDDPVG